MLGIFLGNECNFNCSYCLQPKGRLQPKPLDIERIASFIQERSIGEIRFWGGEPLLYFPLIEEIVHGLEIRGVKADMAMVTNGSLLNEEITNFLGEKGIYTCLSYHKAIDLDCLDHLARLERKSINYLVTKESLELWDLLSLKERFESLFYQEICTLPIYVNATPSCPEKFYLSKKEVEHHIGHLRFLRQHGLAWTTLDALKGAWDQKAAGYKPGYAKCMNHQHVSIDLSGRVLPCHYAQTVGAQEVEFGRIPDFELIPSTQRHINSQTCRECEILPYCQGGCHLSQTHEVDCLLAKELYNFLYVENAFV